MEGRFESLFHSFQAGVEISKNRPCLGYRPFDKSGDAGDYVWQSYAEVGIASKFHV